jgi:hypothetical protein
MTREFEILFKVFETIGYLTDELSAKEKHVLFRDVIIGRQFSSLGELFSGTTLNLIQSEAANFFRGRSELRTDVSGAESPGKPAAFEDMLSLQALENAEQISRDQS